MIIIICKVYNDGSSFVGTLLFKSKNIREKAPRLITKADEIFNSIYMKVNKFLKPNKLFKIIKEEMLEQYKDENIAEEYLDNYITKKLKNKKSNLYARKKRFERKCNMVDLTKYVPYFVTFTYDDKKQTFESFEKKLRKCLSNLSSRRGYRYGLVDELGELGERLHFHGIIFVPNGEMVGKLEKRMVYSKKLHKQVECNENSFFTKRFGQNDWQDLGTDRTAIKRKISYILKYIGKQNNKVIYSRGMPAEVVLDVCEETDVVCEMLDYVLKFVLFDDVIRKDRSAVNVRSVILPDLSEFDT